MQRPGFNDIFRRYLADLGESFSAFATGRATVRISPLYHVEYHTNTMPPKAAGPVGQSGYSYSIERVLQEKGIPPRRVYLARHVLLKLNCQTTLADSCRPSAGNHKFILKDVSQSDFKYFQDMYRDLRSCPYLRLSQDTVPEQSMFVYKYFSDDLLRLVRKDLPIALTKRILKDTLRGLAALHDQNIIHTGKLGLYCAWGP
jgi:serine/threonine protein kinase